MSERKTDPLFWEKLRTWLLGAILLVLLVFSAVFVSAAVRLNRYEAQIGEIVDRLDRVSAQLDELDTEAMVRTVNEVTDALEAAKIARIVDSLQDVSDQLRAVDWEELAGNVNDLALQAQESLETAREALSKASVTMDEIDLETLNQAISDLKDVVEPLAAFAKRFR